MASVNRNGFDSIVAGLDDWDGDLSSPISGYGYRQSSSFGRRRSPGGIGTRNHLGIDLTAGSRGYAAQSAAPGRVTFAGRMRGFGNLVEVEHPNGLRTRYGHLDAINVRVGQDIARGTPIGLVGSTGRSTGPHLHFEVRDQKGRAINPNAIANLAPRATPLPSARPRSPSETQAIASAHRAKAASMPPGMTNLAGSVPAPADSMFSMAAYAAPAPAMARSPSPTFTTPSAERFGRTAHIDPTRFAREGTVAPSIPGPVSPAGPYASVLDKSVAPARSVAPTPAVTRGWAGSLLGVPSTKVATSSVPASAVPSRALAPTFTPDLSSMPANANRLSPVPTDMATLANAPRAIDPVQPQTVQALAPARIQPQVPGALAYAPSQSDDAMPSVPAMRGPTAADVYSGRAESGMASDGSTVSRDQFGNTTISNRFGGITTTTPDGRQMGRLSFSPSFGSPDDIDGFGNEIGANVANRLDRAGRRLSAPFSAQRIGNTGRKAIGGALAGALGTYFGGPVAGALAMQLGANLATTGTLSGMKTYPSAAFGNVRVAAPQRGFAFPGAPSAPTQAQIEAVGGNRPSGLTKAERDSLSPAASRAISRGKGGLY